MGQSTREISATYLPLFAEYLDGCGIAAQYEVQVKELAAPSLRFELHEKLPPKWWGTIEFECGEILELMAPEGDARRTITRRLEALLRPMLSNTTL